MVWFCGLVFHSLFSLCDFFSSFVGMGGGGGSCVFVFWLWGRDMWCYLSQTELYILLRYIQRSKLYSASLNEWAHLVYTVLYVISLCFWSSFGSHVQLYHWASCASGLQKKKFAPSKIIEELKSRLVCLRFPLLRKSRLIFVLFTTFSVSAIH